MSIEKDLWDRIRKMEQRISFLEANAEGGGAGGGDVATDAIWDAKGDLAVGTGPNAASKLAVGANDKFPIAASGETTGMKWTSSHAFMISQTAGNTQNMASGATTKLTSDCLDTETLDVEGWFDLPNTKYAPQDAGYYLIGGLCTIQTLGDAKKYILHIYKNGAQEITIGRGTTGVEDYAGVAGASIVYFNGSTDYVELYFYHNHGSDREIGHPGGLSMSFWGFKVF